MAVANFIRLAIKVDANTITGLHMILPIDSRQSLIKVIGTFSAKLRQYQQNAVGQPRPQTQAIHRREIGVKNHRADGFPQWLTT